MKQRICGMMHASYLLLLFRKCQVLPQTNSVGDLELRCNLEHREVASSWHLIRIMCNVKQLILCDAIYNCCVFEMSRVVPDRHFLNQNSVQLMSWGSIDLLNLEGPGY